MIIPNEAGRRQDVGAARTLEKLRRLGRGCVIIGALATSRPGMAQQSVPFTPATLDTMAVAIARHRQVLAADSMRVDVSPRAARERTANYVAAEFKRLGLEPRFWQNVGQLLLDLPPHVTDSQSRDAFLQTLSWVQRYPVTGHRWIDYAASKVWFFAERLTDARGSAIVMEDGDGVMRSNTLKLTQDARLSSRGWGSIFPTGDGGDDAVLVAGPHTVASLRNAAVRSRPAIYVPSPRQSPAVRQEIIDYLVTMCEGVIVVEDVDSAAFAATLRASNQERRPFLDAYVKQALGAPGWVIHMRREAVAPPLAWAGSDLTRLDADTASLQTVRKLYVGLSLQAESASDTVTAPNVIGVLEGTDSALKKEYVMISASMGGGDAAITGRDALPALLAVAAEFARPGARPRRSMLFVATSAAAQEGWGSAFLSSTLPDKHAPTKVVASIHLDTRGHASGDTITVDGAADVDWTVPLAWRAAQYPELRLVARPGSTLVRPQAQTDALVFVRRRIPTFVFQLPSPGEGAEVGETGTTVKAPLAARASGLMYLVSHAIAAAAERAGWTAETRQRFLQLFPSSP